MRILTAILILFCSLQIGAQVNNIVMTAGIAHTDGPPTFKPGSRGSVVAVDTLTGLWWVNPNRLSGATWIKMGHTMRQISGCAAPSGAPTAYQSWLVSNTCTTPETYLWDGSAWDCLTCASGGATNLSWTEVSTTLYRLNSSTGNDVHIKEGSGVTAALSGDTLTLTASGGGGTVTTDATLDGDGSGGDPLKIAQQSAETSEMLMWTGATWEPSWGNPYTFVTSGATITTDVNEILIGTASGNLTFGLPTCNSANDGKRFKFVRNGTDAFSLTIDPSGSQTFYDGTLTKTSFGTISTDCTCRFSGGTGVWFFDNF